MLASFGTVFGITTSLGLGAQQMTTGFNHITGWAVFVAPVLNEAGIEDWRAGGTPALTGSVTAQTVLIGIMSMVATILLVTYFVTSSNSGTLVNTTLFAAGDPEPPMAHRVIWGLGEAMVAAVLLLAGDLAALQTASIAAALQLSVIVIAMVVGLMRALGEEPSPGGRGGDRGAAGDVDMSARQRARMRARREAIMANAPRHRLLCVAAFMAVLGFTGAVAQHLTAPGVRSEVAVQTPESDPSTQRPGIGQLARKHRVEAKYGPADVAGRWG